MSQWTDWRLEGEFMSQFKKMYRRDASIRRKICFSGQLPNGQPSGIERATVEVVCEGKTFELEDVLKSPDGITDYALIREYDSSKNVVLVERRFPSYLEAEHYLLERI